MDSYKYIGKTVYKIHDFLSWQRSNSLSLSPSFQRRPVWNKSAKSYLIDTIVKGLPIPIIFIREQTDLKTFEPLREVIDGQQRLRTLISFIEPNLLKDYSESDNFTVKRSHNKELSSKTFSDYPSKLQQRILNYEFSVHVLPSETEDSEVLQIFARMNSTGVKLNKQELRNAEFYGLFKDMCYDLAYEQLNRWRAWDIFTETDIARMIEVEETSDLIRFIIEGKLQSKSQPALDKLYFKYDETLDSENIIKNRFRLTMNKIDEIVGKKIEGTVFSRKAVFSTLFVFIYTLLYGESATVEHMATPQKLNDSKISDCIRIAAERIESGHLPDDLIKVLRGGTGNLESRKIRLKFVSDIYESI